MEAISEVDSFTGELINELNSVKIFPSKHSVTTQDKIEQAVGLIRTDLEGRCKYLKEIGKNIEAERIKTRTEYDIEIMLMSSKYCDNQKNKYCYGS